MAKLHRHHVETPGGAEQQHGADRQGAAGHRRRRGRRFGRGGDWPSRQGAEDAAPGPPDRSHPRKRLRPLASGALSIPTATLLVALLLVIGFTFAALTGVLVVICMYAALSLAYSFKLKEIPLVDLFILVALYTLRLVGGGEATGHFLSLWLLAFSGFLFLSLASLKRVAELMDIETTGGRLIVRRGYETRDSAILATLGCCASFASCIVLALFVQDQTKLNQYASPELLWSIVPLMLFWQCRLWLVTTRGDMQDDPIVYASRDWVSWIVAILVLMILTAAAVY